MCEVSSLINHELTESQMGLPDLGITKAYFHSDLSPVASNIFRMGHAQCGETNRIGQKISSAQFAFEVQIFQQKNI